VPCFCERDWDAPGGGSGTEKITGGNDTRNEYQGGVQVWRSKTSQMGRNECVQKRKGTGTLQGFYKTDRTERSGNGKKEKKGVDLWAGKKAKSMEGGRGEDLSQFVPMGIKKEKKSRDTGGNGVYSVQKYSTINLDCVLPKQ